MDTANEASKKTKLWKCCELREGKNHDKKGNIIKLNQTELNLINDMIRNTVV